ncbi:MAG TPA: AMP-binding protein [Variovorax sp.]|nr:AMP-binding protein [Variovorax sp.]
MPSFDPWLSITMAMDAAAAGHADGAGLAARRERRLGALLKTAAERSPLFRRLLAGRTALCELPVTRKTELMAQFSQWLTEPRLRLPALHAFIADPGNIGRPFMGRYTVWESSGSSGEPCIFVQDAAAMAAYDALEAVRRPRLRPLSQWLDPYWLGERMAFVGATNGHFASTVGIARLRQLNPVLAPRLHILDFLQPMAQLVHQLNALSPTIVATYPSAAVLLAKERQGGRLRAAVREIWTGGEELSPAMRRFVQTAFDCPVTNSYGASEFLSLAFECPLGQLHLNSDWAILESVDERGRPVPDGTAGATTLLTNLANHVQPLIRYDLGDRVRLHAQACSCGSHLPVLEVEGRCDDTLHLGGAPAEVSVLPLALCTVLESEAGLFDFQLVQEGPSALLLRTRLRGDAADSALQRGRRALEAFLRTQGARGVHIRCRSAQACPGGRSGKVQRVVGAGH